MYIRLIPHYLFWHYTLGIRDFIRIAERLLMAISRIFSLRLMFITFFQPFERLGEHYHGGGVSQFIETFIVTTLMRMVGMVVRTCIIILGIIACLLALIFSLAGVIVWIFLPVMMIGLLYVAVLNLIKAI